MYAVSLLFGAYLVDLQAAPPVQRSLFLSPSLSRSSPFPFLYRCTSLTSGLCRTLISRQDCELSVREHGAFDHRLVHPQYRRHFSSQSFVGVDQQSSIHWRGDIWSTAPTGAAMAADAASCTTSWDSKGTGPCRPTPDVTSSGIRWFACSCPTTSPSPPRPQR